MTINRNRFKIFRISAAHYVLAGVHRAYVLGHCSSIRSSFWTLLRKSFESIVPGALITMQLNRSIVSLDREHATKGDDENTTCDSANVNCRRRYRDVPS
jgi:hypothetical protein